MPLSDLNLVANTYAGDALTDIISSALLMENGLVADGLVTPVSGLKGPRKMRKADLAVELHDPSAVFAPVAGDISLDEAVLSPVKMEFHKEYDLTALFTTWEANDLTAGAMNDGDASAKFISWMEGQISSKLGIANEKLYARGKSFTPEATFTATYPGLVGRLEASGNTIKLASNVGVIAGSAISIAANAVVTVASTATLRDGDWVTIIGANALTLVGGVAINGQSFQITITSATTFTIGSTTTGTATSAAFSVQFINETNVVSSLTKVYSWIPEEVRDDVNIIVPQHVKHAYYKALAAVSLERYTVGARELDFLGEKMIPRKHWNRNTIAVFDPKNVFLGFDLAEDSVSFQMLPMKDVTGDQTIRVRAGMRSDIVAANYNEIVYMRPA
jgi:hypothetical protein